MSYQPLFRTLRLLTAGLFLCSAPLLTSCTDDPDPQPTTGTTGPGSTTTTPGSTTTTPGSGTTTPGSSTTSTPGSSTSTPGTVVAAADFFKGRADLTFITAAVARAGLTADVNKAEQTIFAPTDDAFRAAGFANVAAINAAPEATLKRILQYHVLTDRIDLSAIPTAVATSYQTALSDGRVSVYKVSNSDIRINDAKITQGNNPVTGSVVHIIDKVLTPPSVSATDIAKANADLSLFFAAATKAGAATQTLLTQNTATGVTIFAPNNAAFIAAGYADEAAIQKADPAVLADLLAYHVLKYRAYAQTFQNGADVVTAQGTSVRFGVADGKVTITGKGNGTNAANIVKADQVANSGVIHVIDRVLLPK